MTITRFPTATSIQERLNTLSTRRHVAAVAASFAGLGLANGALNNLYTASNFPVPYAEGQTSFSGTQVKEWYGVMTEAGTLDTYLGTQLFDYVFIAAMMTFGFLASSLITRLTSGPGRAASITNRIARCARLLIPAGAAFDAIENLLSFPMLAQPAAFNDAWAIAHSSAAVVKFALIGTGFVALLVSVVGLALLGLRSAASNQVVPSM